MFLENHSQKYNLSLRDGVLSLATGISGIAYAKRHWELSKTASDSKSMWGHRVISVIEAIPVIGGLAAVIERIAFFVKERFFINKPGIAPQPLKGRVEPLAQPLNDQVEPLPQQVNNRWKPRALAIDVVTQKMWKNSQKAFSEHNTKTPDVYAQALSSAEETIKPETPLICEHFSAETQGPRPTMEDFHFFMETDQGIITGVLDGHGGRRVAEHAGKIFQERFFQLLKENSSNVHQTFELLFEEIQKEVVQKREWNRVGSTAVICFIDKNTHQIFTATAGDSEANIYRKFEGQLKSIPLSCVRDWSSKSDAKRASIALDTPDIATAWPVAPNPKRLRFPSIFYGINVSRAIGDVEFAGTPEKPGVIHKPKIAINQLKQGDILILACDGLKDYVPESQIIDTLKQEGETNPADRLVNHAIKNSAGDNVTVVAIKVK